MKVVQILGGLFIVTIPIFAGCGFYDLVNQSDEIIYQHSAEKRQEETRLAEHLGKTPDEIKAAFGEPYKIHHKSVDADHVPYDMMWLYKGIPGGRSESFSFFYRYFFKDGKVIKIHVD